MYRWRLNVKKICLESHIMKEGFDQLEERLKDMDEGGIDMQVLSYIFLMDESLSASEATSLAKNANEMMAKAVEKYPERFDGFAAIALQDPEAAANELERAVKELGLKGTMIFLPIKDGLDNQKYWVIFERAEKLDVPVYMHPGHPSPDMIKPYLTYPILRDAVWGFSAEGGLQAMRLIFSGLLDKYPNLKIVLGHMGEGIPYWLWRIDNRWSKDKDIDRYIPATGAIELKRKPSQYFKENFYITTSGMFWPPVLQFTNSVLGSDRILFAVDYGAESNKEAVAFIEATPISDSDKEKICHLNAEKLFRL
jgi:2,3-dihydroxybenzoate decarboxylase